MSKILDDRAIEALLSSQKGKLTAQPIQEKQTKQSKKLNEQVSNLTVEEFGDLIESLVNAKVESAIKEQFDKLFNDKAIVDDFSSQGKDFAIIMGGKKYNATFK